MEIFSVLWVPAKILGLPGKGTFGVCGKTRRIFKIARNYMVILMLNDIIIDNNICEEEKRCLDVKCSLNHAANLGINQKDFERLPIEDHWPELIKRLEDLCKKNPKGGLLA